MRVNSCVRSRLRHLLGPNQGALSVTLAERYLDARARTAFVRRNYRL